MNRKDALDTIARYRAEAKSAREAARMMRIELRALKERPMSQRDPYRQLQLGILINENVRRAQQRDTEARCVRAAYVAVKAGYLKP